MKTVCCSQCGQKSCDVCPLREGIISEINALGIGDMEEVKSLNLLKGSYINLEYTLPNGRRVKLLDDNKIYLGNQLHKKGSERCYGIAADEKYLLVCEYGCGGSEAEIVVYTRRIG